MIQRLTISLYPGDMVNMIMIPTLCQQGFSWHGWSIRNMEIFVNIPW